MDDLDSVPVAQGRLVIGRPGHNFEVAFNGQLSPVQLQRFDQGCNGFYPVERPILAIYDDPHINPIRRDPNGKLVTLANQRYKTAPNDGGGACPRSSSY